MLKILYSGKCKGDVLLDIVERIFSYMLDARKMHKIGISKVYLGIHAYSRFLWYAIISALFIPLLNAYFSTPFILFIALSGPFLILWLSEGVMRQSIQKIVMKALESEDHVVTSLKDMKSALDAHKQKVNTEFGDVRSIHELFDMLFHVLQETVRDTIKNIVRRPRKELLKNFVFLPLVINYCLIPLTLSSIIIVFHNLQILDYNISKAWMILLKTPFILLVVTPAALLLHIITAHMIINNILEASSQNLEKEATTSNEGLGIVELFVLTLLVVRLRRLIPVHFRVGKWQKRAMTTILVLYLLLFSLPWDIIVVPKEVGGEKKLKDATLFAVIFAPTSKDLSFEDVEKVLTSGNKPPENPSFMTRLIYEICGNFVRKSYSDKKANNVLSRNPNVLDKNQGTECAHICIKSDEHKERVLMDCMNYFALEELYINSLQEAIATAKRILLNIPTYTCSLQSMLKLIDKDLEKAKQIVIEFFKNYAIEIGDVVPPPDNVLIDNFIKLIRDDDTLNKLGNMTGYFISIQPLIITEIGIINAKQIEVQKPKQQITRNEYCKVEVCIPIVIAIGIATSKTQSTTIAYEMCKE